MPAKSNLRLVLPTGEKWKVMPMRRPNAELRTKEYPTEAEIERVNEVVEDGRVGAAELSS